MTFGTSQPLVAGTNNTVADPWAGSQSPLQYYLANGGNPALIPQFQAYLAALPPDLAKQVTAAPQQAMQLFAQGVQNPTSQGLSFNNGQWVNSQGQAYDYRTDPASQQAMANQDAQWNSMYQNSSRYNNGGKLDINGLPVGNAGNPYTINSMGKNPNVINQPVAPTAPPAPTQGDRLIRTNTTGNPPPPPTPPPPTPPVNDSNPAVVAKTTPQQAYGGGAQYNQPVVNQNVQQSASPTTMTPQGGGAAINPYQPEKNPYSFNTSKGWNV